MVSTLAVLSGDVLKPFEGLVSVCCCVNFGRNVLSLVVASEAIVSALVSALITSSLLVLLLLVKSVSEADLSA